MANRKTSTPRNKRYDFLKSIKDSEIEAIGLKVLTGGRDNDNNSSYIQMCDPEGLFDDGNYICHYEILYMGEDNLEYDNHLKDNIYVEIHFECDKYSRYFSSVVMELSENTELEIFKWRDYCPGLRIKDSAIETENKTQIIKTLKRLKELTLTKLKNVYKETIVANQNFKPEFHFNGQNRKTSETRALSEFYREPKENFVVHEAIKNNLIKEINKKTDMFDKNDPIVKLSPENLVNNSNYIDLVAKTKNGSFIFFEIKTAYEARLCIRQALGQLMEYAFFSGSDYADKLIIIGPGEKTPEIDNYLNKLNEKISVAIDYKMIAAD